MAEGDRDLGGTRGGSGEAWHYDQPSEWNIIAAGPSFRDVHQTDLLNGPVIAINRAVEVREKIEIHIWACWDHPERLFDLGYGRFLYPPLCLWLGSDRFGEFHHWAIGRAKYPQWEKKIDPRIGFRCLQLGHLEDKTGDWAEPKMRAAFTLAYVLEKCADLGAYKIRILGADMAGSWSPSVETEEECVKVTKFNRWAYERDHLREAIRIFDEHGIEIELFQTVASEKR